MSDITLPPALAAMAEREKITAEDVLLMRREVFFDQWVNAHEADTLLELDRRVSDTCVEWQHFFREALVEFVVNQTKPSGIISNDNANWLMEHISKDGLVESPNMLEVLVRCIEVAQASPHSLMAFALAQVKEAVLNNQGPVAPGRADQPNVICKSDVELIRRLMYGFGGQGGMAVVREEAEFLFDLNDATSDHQNDPAWGDLFKRAVGNYLMATLGFAVPTRRVALKQDTWLQGNGFWSVLVNSLRSVMGTTRAPSEVVEAAIGNNNKALEGAMHTAEVVTGAEADWLI